MLHFAPQAAFINYFTGHLISVLLMDVLLPRYPWQSFIGIGEDRFNSSAFPINS
jgi:hypothetical protein